MRRRGFLLTSGLATAGAFGLVACGQKEQHAEGQGAAPRLMVADAWVRTTDGAKDATMSAAFMDITNPTDREVKLVRAECSVAGRVELHEMATVGGKKVMRPVQAVTIPAGGHRHLVSGGNHIMLMDLKRPLPIGDQVEVTLAFDEGTTIAVTCMVKEFTEEEDHYHSTPAPTGS